MEDSIRKNTAHYDDVYQKEDIDKIIKNARNYKDFLSVATITDTSWHGLYYGDFENKIKGKKVLELGCGNGLNALIMGFLGAEVTAIDISSKSEIIIKEATRILNLDNVSSISGDFREIDLPYRTFDFVVGKAFIHHLTNTLEEEFVKKIILLLKLNGEARFFEPSINNKFIDEIRWITPVPGRPSKLDKKAFAIWKQNDPHPQRDNSSKHYLEMGNKYFNETEIIWIGTLERFSRLMPKGKLERNYRRWAHRNEEKIPNFIRKPAARSQTIIYQNPKDMKLE